MTTGRVIISKSFCVLTQFRVDAYTMESFVYTLTGDNHAEAVLISSGCATALCIMYVISPLCARLHASRDNKAINRHRCSVLKQAMVADASSFSHTHSIHGFYLTTV